MNDHDRSARDRLVEKIVAVAGSLSLRMPLPVVSVRDFMDGNDDRDSLAVNVTASRQEFLALRHGLLELAEVPGVVAVLVEIHEISDGAWPYSERVYVVVSRWNHDDVVTRCEALRPSDIGEGWLDERPPGAPPMSASDRVLSLWWD